MALSARDRLRLHGVHHDLVRVVERASEMMEFIVIEGTRTLAKQRTYLEAGASHTLLSKHVLVPSRAVDLAVVVDGTVCWKWPIYERLNDVMQRSADLEHVRITWGGSWPKLRDGVHFELQDVDVA